jgi:glycosyltransferase involved in cell wall biosynthesis
MSARLYGHSLGESSFVQVTRGFQAALEAKGIFAGFVAIDNLSVYDEEPAPGAIAPVSFNTGAPAGVAIAKALGAHDQRWLMLAPNSDKVPAQMLEWFPKEVTGLLTPSEWGKEMVQNGLRHAHWKDVLPVVVCPHGVTDAMRPPATPLAAEGFRCLHMTSTLAERKGTEALIRAWKRFVEGSGEGCSLTIVCDPVGRGTVLDMVRRLGATSVVIETAWRWTPELLAAFYATFHCVVQPSRAEGFGLVPLEAAACGVVVAATYCTGHTEHLGDEADGVVRIKTRPDAAIDDYPGARAPGVEADDVLEALHLARTNWGVLSANAWRRAPEIAREWSWANKTGSVLENIVERSVQ